MEKRKYVKYLEIMNFLQLNYCLLTEKGLNELYNQDKLDINDNFTLLEDKRPIIPIKDIDNYIVCNINIWKHYKKDMFFQYAYMVISNYTFDDKKEFLEYLKNTYSAIYNLDIAILKKIVKKLSKKKIAKFEVDDEQINITRKINNLFNNEIILRIIKEKLNNKETFSNILESCIEDVEVVVEKIIFSVLLFKEKVDEKEIVQLLTDKTDFDEFIYNKILRLLNIRNQSNQKEKQKVLDFIYHELVEEGYFLHGTNSINLENILANGFSSIKVPMLTNHIRKINEIFERHKLFMNFEGKMSELKLHQYYVTDSIISSVMYAFQSPEYLSRFCSNGYHQEDIRIFDREAFWRRDFDACYSNIELLCTNYNFSKREKTNVLQRFKELWDSNVSSEYAPVIFIGKKKNIGRNHSEKFARISNHIEQYTVQEIIKLFELGDNIHDKRLSNINPESLTYFFLPNIHEMYSLSSFDKVNSKQYIIYKNKKYYPDIVITKSIANKKGIIIDDDVDNLMELGKNLIIIPQNKRNLSIGLNEFCEVNLHYLVAESGVAVTEKGQNFITNLRRNISLDSIIKHNESLIDNCIEYWDENHGNLDIFSKMELVHFIIRYLLVKTISMKKYNNFYIDIDEALNKMIYYSIDRDNKLNKMMKQKTTDDEFVEETMEIIKDILNNNYKPYCN